MLIAIVLLLAVVAACALTIGHGAPAPEQVRLPQPRVEVVYGEKQPAVTKVYVPVRVTL